MSEKKNILFLSADELSYDALACRGNPYVSTPNMDRMMALGTSFECSYSTNPVCAPARASWMTGLYSCETGVPFNDGAIHPDIPDLGEYLSQQGYYAAHSGKWHVLGRDVGQGFHVLYEGKRVMTAGGAEVYDNATAFEAIRFLEEYEGEQPFFLQVHYINPHDVCEHLHSFEDDRKKIQNLVELGILNESDLPPLPPNFDAIGEETFNQIVCRRMKNALVHEKIRLATEKWGELEWRCYLWHYYRFIENVDRQIGKLLAAVESSRFRDNTVLLFTTDHGEGAANHRMFQKFTLYEESVHVPFCVFEFSENFGIRKGFSDTAHLVSGVDIFATICDMAGVPQPENTHGQSVLPLCRGEAVTWRDSLFIEVNCYGRAVIKDGYKLITEYLPEAGTDSAIVTAATHRFGRSQLYDLKNDPKECRNLADEMSEKVAAYQQELCRLEAQMTPREIPNEKGKQVFRTWSQRTLDYLSTQ